MATLQSCPHHRNISDALKTVVNSSISEIHNNLLYGFVMILWVHKFRHSKILSCNVQCGGEKKTKKSWFSKYTKDEFNIFMTQEGCSINSSNLNLLCWHKNQANPLSIQKGIYNTNEHKDTTSFHYPNAVKWFPPIEAWGVEYMQAYAR